MTGKLVRTATLTVLSLVSFAALAQELSPLVERVDVRVVNVDVTVLDHNGRPVLGLTREDFEVFEDGNRQKVTGLYAIEDAAVLKETGPGQRQSSADVDDFRRKLVLMVDNTSIDKIRRDRALDTINNYVESEFSEDYEWSVMSVGSEVRTLQPFTVERGEIQSALLQLRQSPTYEIRRELDRRLLSDPVRARLRESEFESGYDFGETARFQSREQTMRNILATINTARAVIQTCRAYSASAGKKLLLLVTGGMELNTSFSAYDQNSDRQMMEMKRQLEQILDAMVREANAANFTIYVINARGLEQVAPQHDVAERSSGTQGDLTSSFQASAFAKSSDLSDRHSASLSLTMGTGGRYLPSNDTHSSLEIVDTETSNFYSLGYVPEHPEDGEYHQIEVRVKRPNLTVRHRQAYRAITPEARLEQTLRAPMTFPKEKGALPVQMEIGTPEPARASAQVVPITASLPVGRITMFPRGDQSLGRVHVYLSIYNDHGENIGFLHRVRDLSIPTSQLSANQHTPFRYIMKVPLKRGTYTVGMTLRDELTGETGSIFREIRL